MIIKYLWYFLIYSFLGYFLEVIYHLLNNGKFVNRGFLKGTYCPIYGFGALFIIYILKNITNPIYVYIAGVIITTVIEYFTGDILKKFFGLSWWDYTDERFNIKGYVCLKFSMLWGIASLVLMYIIHPRIKMFIKDIQKIRFSNVLLTILTVVIVIDFISTVLHLLKNRLEMKWKV